MIVSAIQKSIDEFYDYLTSGKHHSDESLLYYEATFHWQSNWDVHAADLVNSYSLATQHTVTKRLWQEDSYRPREAMLALIGYDTQFVRSMFLNLFDETMPFNNRIDRFLFLCDEIFAQYQDSHPHSLIAGHYHTSELIYRYLALQYPSVYSVYNIEDIKICLGLWGAKDILPVADPERFNKVTKIVHNFMMKKEGLPKAIALQLNGRMAPSQETLLDVSYLCAFTARKVG